MSSSEIRPIQTDSDLASEQVKVLGAGGGVGHLEVDVLTVWPHLARVRHLQEAFQTTGAVFGSHTVVAVRQQERQAGALHPLGYGRIQTSDTLR